METSRTESAESPAVECWVAVGRIGAGFRFPVRISQDLVHPSRVALVEPRKSRYWDAGSGFLVARPPKECAISKGFPLGSWELKIGRVIRVLTQQSRDARTES